MSRLDPTVWAGEPEVTGVDGPMIDLPHLGNQLVTAVLQPPGGYQRPGMQADYHTRAPLILEPEDFDV